MKALSKFVLDFRLGDEHYSYETYTTLEKDAIHANLLKFLSQASDIQQDSFIAFCNNQPGGECTFDKAGNENLKNDPEMWLLVGMKPYEKK